MTKSGSFKRAVRKHARETGQRYTQARAAMTRGQAAEPVRRQFEEAALKSHLEERYGIRITALSPVDDHPESAPRDSWPGHYPSTLYAKRDAGTPWIARIFSSPTDKVSRVEGDAEILRFLTSNDFPAERLAHEEPVSVLDGSGVIVTEFIEGGRPASSAEVQHELGSLLGRLHSLPAAGGAVARDGGSEDTLGDTYVGRPKQDLAAAMSFLASVEDAVAPAGREKFEWLRDQVETADDAEGLPEAFTHGNYHLWAAVGTPGNLHIVGWAGSGRGPRLPALAWLLRTAAETGKIAEVEAVVRGYREHVRLTDEELDRLPGVLNMKPIWLACLEYRMCVRGGTTPTFDNEPGWVGWRPEHGEQIARHVVPMFLS